MTHQKINLVGHLGQDPQLRHTPTGQVFTQFSLATHSRWTGPDGQAYEETTWFQVSAWGNLAKACHTYLQKGQPVLVEGRLTVDRETGGPRVWTDPNGSVRASFEVTALEVKFLGQKPSSTTDEPGPGGEAVDDEIPF